MRRPTGIALLCVSALIAGMWTGAAEAKRVYYEANGHRYWYNPSKHAGPPARRGRTRTAKVDAWAADMSKPAAAGVPALRTDTVATVQPPDKARLDDRRAVSPERASPRVAARMSRGQRRALRREAIREAQRRVIESRLAAKVKDLSVQQKAMPAQSQVPVEAPLSSKAAEAATALVMSANLVAPPPGPSLINRVTYDFERGVKTTSLRDGAVFVEDFDPKAFFRVLPDPTPQATSSIVVGPSPAGAPRP